MFRQTLAKGSGQQYPASASKRKRPESQSPVGCQVQPDYVQ